MRVVAKGLQPCDAGDEFDRRRCIAERDAARALLAREEFVVGARAPLQPMDFRTSRFPVDVPRMGKLVLDPYMDVTGVGADEVAQVRLEVEAADHRVTAPISDRGEAEAIKKAGAPMAILLVRGRGFERAGVTNQLDERMVWQLMESNLGAQAGGLRTRTVETWRQNFTTVGVQILSPTDGAVLLSRPPAIEFRDADPAECAEVEQDEDRREAFRARLALMRAALAGTDPFVPNRNW